MDLFCVLGKCFIMLYCLYVSHLTPKIFNIHIYEYIYTYIYIYMCVYTDIYSIHRHMYSIYIYVFVYTVYIYTYEYTYIDIWHWHNMIHFTGDVPHVAEAHGRAAAQPLKVGSPEIGPWSSLEHLHLRSSSQVASKAKPMSIYRHIELYLWSCMHYMILCVYCMCIYIYTDTH
jgi:hypothetical protein